MGTCQSSLRVCALDSVIRVVIQPPGRADTKTEEGPFSRWQASSLPTDLGRPLERDRWAHWSMGSATWLQSCHTASPTLDKGAIRLAVHIGAQGLSGLLNGHKVLGRWWDLYEVGHGAGYLSKTLLPPGYPTGPILFNPGLLCLPLRAKEVVHQGRSRAGSPALSLTPHVSQFLHL